MVGFTLKRPQARLPTYEAKAILVVGSQDDESKYARGQGLELVPEKPLSELKPGDELPVSLMLDGKRIANPITAQPEKGKQVFLRCREDQPALVRLTGSGRYLVYANVKGRGCSLVFYVQDKPK